MSEKEKEIVNKDFLKRNDVYNLAEGGNGGFRGEASREKQRLKMKGRVPSEAERQRHKEYSQKRIGKKDSEEVRLKKKMAAQNIKKDWNRGRISIYKENFNKFIYPSELEFYLQIGWTRGKNPNNILRGNKRTVEQKIKQSKKLKEYYKTHESCRKGKKAFKRK